MKENYKWFELPEWLKAFTRMYIGSDNSNETKAIRLTAANEVMNVLIEVRATASQSGQDREGDLLEKLAELAHLQWSGWMEYLFSKGELNTDGSFTIAKWAVERWTKQSQTEYKDLSQSEQESDRTEARKFLNILQSNLSEESIRLGYEKWLKGNEHQNRFQVWKACAQWFRTSAGTREYFTKNEAELIFNAGADYHHFTDGPGEYAPDFNGFIKELRK